MILSKEQQQTMLEAAKPLMKWMSENCHPHCQAVVDQVHIEVLEGLATNSTQEFIKK